MLILTGCTVNSRYGDKRGPLDDSLYYFEQDTNNNKFGISESSVNQQQEKIPQRVPQPALVDKNSTIEILVNKSQLVAGDKKTTLPISDAILNKKKSINDILIALERVIHARQRAIEAYQKDDMEDFLTAKNEFGTTEDDLYQQIKKVWPRGTKEYAEVSRAFDKPTFKHFQEYLQNQIKAIENNDKTLSDEAKRRAITLRLEAFLIAPKKDPIAIHLDGYDLLKKGELQRIDSMGLNLSDAERQTLVDQWQATQQVAAAAESVRKGEEISSGCFQNNSASSLH